jgi:hypothetical protein
MKAFRLAVAAVSIVLLTSLAPALAAGISAEPAAEVPRDSAGVSVRSGSIVLKVSDYDQARSRVMRLAAARGAVLHDEKSEANFSGERHGSIILELDAAQLGPMMEAVRRIGKLYSEHVQTSDQTSYYQKLEKRISLLKQNEVELLAFLHSPRRMRGSDILFVQYRLYESRVQAADAAQERADTARRAQKALVNVALFEAEPRKTLDWSNWHATASYRAKGSFLYVTRKLVTGFYLLVFLAPYWIPALLIVFFGGRKLIRWTRQRLTAWLERRRPTGREGV